MSLTTAKGKFQPKVLQPDWGGKHLLIYRHLATSSSHNNRNLGFPPQSKLYGQDWALAHPL
jgi:hypothetical protein